MEQNVQVMGRRVWHIVRVAFFMLRKNITKRKLLLDLKYLALKRSNKLAGKLTHHHNHHPLGGAYEVNVPHAPNFGVDMKSELDAVNRVLEKMMVVGPTRNDDVEAYPYLYSPVLPGFGFGQSPAVRQLRVTDSSYPVYGGEEGELGNYPVDQAAEEFIQRFYNQLNQQRITEY